MSENEAPNSSVVPPAQPAVTRGESRHRTWESIEGFVLLLVVLSILMAVMSMATAFGMTPEEHIWPVGAPFAVALLGLGLACSVWLPLRRPVTGLRPRRGVQVLAGLTSLVACLWLPLVFYQLWVYSGPLWRSVQNDQSAQWVLSNILLWIPIGLLMVSVGLACLSRSRRLQLLVWLAVTIPGFVLWLWVVCVGAMWVGGG